jgi:hypothetical protein
MPRSNDTSREDLRRRPVVQDAIIDRRAVLVGSAAFLLLVCGTLVWKFSTPGAAAPQVKEFEFSVEEPVAEKFELAEPKREILTERPEQAAPSAEVASAADERPDIHMTRVPAENVQATEEVIQTDNVKVATPEISPGPFGADMEVDAPQEVSEYAEKAEYALNVIAADTLGPADIFKYKDPAPPGKQGEYFVNRAPKPGRGLAAMPEAFGRQDAPSMGKLGPVNINLFGNGDYFRTMTRYGDTASRSAVDSALHWLAMYQEPAGHWSAANHDGTGAAQADTADTALAVLALMGGGNTIRKGEYRRSVLRGLEELIRRQKDDGSVDKNTYAHSMCTIALCEAYGRARDERVGLAARKAVAYLEKGVNPDGGWRYTANCGVSDMSVTGWCIMALKTAKLAQIQFDERVYSQALAFVDSVTDRGAGKESTGAVGYLYSQMDEIKGNGRAAMTCAAMMVRQFSGVGVKSAILDKGARLTREAPPDWKKKDFYYWYYATYAMHNMGGEYRIWWNRRIRDVLLDNQQKDGDNAGSWDPKGDHWAAQPGRAYTTALGALCLEVYYRYSEACNSFGIAPDLDDLFLQ